MTTNINSNKKDFYFYIKLLSILMYLDYILTYIGIQLLAFITELNPFMLYLTTLPIISGIFFRLLIIFLPATLLSLAFKISKGKKMVFTVTKLLVLFQFIPLSMHLIWLIKYACV